jgi:hypothetical protein
MRDAAHTSTTNDKMILKSSGELGIGVSPQEKLHVDGDVSIGTGGTGGTASLKFVNDNERSRITSNYDSGGGGRLGFWTDTTGGTLLQRLTIKNSGNVGIGTDVPGHPLDVDGDINARGTYRTDQVSPPVRPSLLLDFANSKSLDKRMSFTRSTTATYWDGKTTAKAEENLWFPSTSYGQEAVLDDGTVIVTNNNATAPDGTSTAAKVQDNSASTSHYIVKPETGIDTTSTYTLSFYVKYGSGYGWVGIGLASAKLAWFDVQNGTQGSEHSTVQSTSITSVGNGWYRCVVAINPNGSTDYWQIRLCNADNTVTYTANGSFVYVWGAQLEKRSAVTAYTPTTSSPVVKFQPVLQTAPAHIPRFDHDPVTRESLGILVEEARTNYAGLSTPTTGWGQGSQMVTPNYSIAPDGTQTAAFIHESATSVQQLTYTTLGQVLTSGSTYTFSVYAKAYTHASFQLHSYGDSSKGFNLASPSNSSDSSMTHVGNGWYRCTWSKTKTNTNSQTYLGFSGSAYAGDANKGLLFWGAQVELGNFATSQIPTAGSAVTRASDAIYDHNIKTSGWWNAAQGTVFADYTHFDNYVDSPYPRIHLHNPNTSRTTIELMHFGGVVRHHVFSANSLKFSQLKTVAADNRILSAIAFDFNELDAGSSITGTSTDSGTLTSTPRDLSRLDLGTSGFNGHIRKFAFYQHRLTGTELTALTES